MEIPHGFKGAAKRLEDIDIPRIGHIIGVGEDEVHAVMDVEASGSGFDSQGRPKMLFEPHIFYRQLKGAKRDRAVREGLAYRKWRRNYPADSYPRLYRAMAIDENAALRSASWQLGQIMGFNYKLAGYPSVKAFVADMCEDEDNGLEAMINFIKNSGIDDDLRRHDWRGFARVYNGEKYYEHNYHGRLEERFLWWKGKPDTPWEPGMGEDEPATPHVPEQPATERIGIMAWLFSRFLPMVLPVLGSILVPEGKVKGASGGGIFTKMRTFVGSLFGVTAAEQTGFSNFDFAPIVNWVAGLFGKGGVDGALPFLSTLEWGPIVGMLASAVLSNVFKEHYVVMTQKQLEDKYKVIDHDPNEVTGGGEKDDSK